MNQAKIQRKFEIAAMLSKNANKSRKALVVTLPNAMTDADVGQMLSMGAKYDTKRIFFITPAYPTSAQRQMVRTINNNTKIKITVLVTSNK